MKDEANLTVGKCYFALFYHDKDLRMPDIHTLIYVGKNICSKDEESTKEHWCFLDPVSYLKQGPEIDEERCSEYKLHRFDNQSLFSLHDWEGLIEELLENKRAQDKGEIFN